MVYLCNGVVYIIHAGRGEANHGTPKEGMENARINRHGAEQPGGGSHALLQETGRWRRTRRG
jgi:hypothetical protein